MPTKRIRRNKSSSTPVGALLAGGLHGWRPEDSEQLARFNAEVERRLEAERAREELLEQRRDQYIHDAFDREHDR